MPTIIRATDHHRTNQTVAFNFDDLATKAGQYLDQVRAEAAKIVAAAKTEANQQMMHARDALRDQVAALAVKGAEQILRKEVSPAVHADLLSRLKTEL